MQHQWQVNKGKCGLCGDPLDRLPRPHEDVNQYAKGVIVRNYTTSDPFIDVTIEVKANMKGHFEFRLCDDISDVKKLTQECLDKHLLVIKDHGKQFKPNKIGNIFLKLRMPKGVTCKHCVLQWKWKTGKVHEKSKCLHF